ncbi:MAG: tyrosine-type recombinase/integrase [Pseudoflavonifractor sp.]|nr:tyrosine-type recombinase/integrase [Pseudoflavonifractor sp.]
MVQKKDMSKATLSEWLNTWLEQYMLGKKYGTVKSYRAQIKTNIDPYIGHVSLCNLSIEHINYLYNLLSVGIDKERQPLSAKSVRNVHGILHEALAVAFELGYIEKNPSDCRHLIQLPQVVKAEIRPLTDSQIKLFLRKVNTDVLANYFKLVLFTGLRESEAMGLTWDCIDFTQNTIRVEKQLQKRPISDGGYVFVPLKNNRTRTIVAAPALMQVLRAERLKQAEARLCAGVDWKGWTDEQYRRSALVFTTESGAHLTQSTIRRHYKRLVEEMGLPKCRVHDLRHTFAVLSLQNGDDIKTVQENLGHATAAFTLDVYGHVSDRMKAASAARMQQYICDMKGVKESWEK